MLRWVGEMTNVDGLASLCSVLGFLAFWLCFGSAGDSMPLKLFSVLIFGSLPLFLGQHLAI